MTPRGRGTAHSPPPPRRRAGGGAGLDVWWGGCQALPPVAVARRVGGSARRCRCLPCLRNGAGSDNRSTAALSARAPGPPSAQRQPLPTTANYGQPPPIDLTTMGEKFPFRARNPDNTRQLILDAARIEFAKAGLSGARVDKIAETSGVNKRMIYHYFGGKELLFAAVVEAAYMDIRSQERALGLSEMPPKQAMGLLLDFTWKYHLQNPAFITLVNSENLHQARHIEGNRQLRKLQKAYVGMVEGILQRGVASGEFRQVIDPVQLCISIAAVSFYYLNNPYTGPVLFCFYFINKNALLARRQFNTQTIMRMVAARPD